MDCQREDCWHDVSQHDPAPEDDPTAYGGCSECDCPEFVWQEGE
jgi:hypothetical protein